MRVVTPQRWGANPIAERKPRRDPGDGVIATKRRRHDSDAQPPKRIGDVVSGDAYLRSSHGFLVDFLVDGADGSEIGVVDEVEVDPTTGRPTRLHVGRGWFRRHRYVFGVEDVIAVDPAARRLVVSPRPGADATGR